MARINGALSGTPFFLAMIPRYLSYLRQEARMWMQIAALHGATRVSCERSPSY
jgi:hypothetical protein